MIARLLFAALAVSLAAHAASAQSTIDTTLPVQGKAYNAAPIRQNFTAAANDINALVRMSAGATAPSSPVTGRLWLDTSSATTYTLKMYVSGSASWLPVAALNVSAGLWAPPVGGGTIPSLTSASTTNLGSVPQAAINITGSQAIASFGSSAPEGQVKFLVFTGSPQLIYNATFMILPGSANLVLSAGETAIALSLGGGRWRVGFSDITACGLFTSIAAGCVPASGGGATNYLRADGTWAPPAGVGTVTSVGLSVPATSIFGVTGSPVTGAGTLGLTTTGTSGGIPYFSSGTQLSTSAALTANAPVIGGGAGVAPSVGTRSGNTTTFGTTSGALTSGNIAVFDADGNLVAFGAAPVTSCAGLSDDGTACTANTGTSGHTLPYLDGANSWSGTQTFAAAIGSTNEQSGTTYTLAASDCGKTVIFTAATTVTVTIPASIAPAAGNSCHTALWQQGAGSVVVTGSAVAAATRVSYGGFTQTAGQYAILGISLTTISAVATANITGAGA